jgi:dipeptidyl aminopeptidase/acylaminoacyl peptidase
MPRENCKIAYGARAILLLAVILVFDTARAQIPLRPEELIERHEISELEWSPDGQQLAMVVTQPVSDEGQPAHIWVYEASTSLLRQLTVGDTQNRRPRWSADGSSLTFLSSRDDERMQIFQLPMGGGEAKSISDPAFDIDSYEWSPSGDVIAFLAPDTDPKDIEDDVESKDDEIVVSEVDKPLRLWSLDVSSGSARSISSDGWRVSGFAWRPGKTGLVISATQSTAIDLLTDRFYSIDRDGENLNEVVSPDGPISKFSVSSNNLSLAYIGSKQGGPIPHGLFLQSLEGGNIADLSAGSLDRMIEDFKWSDDGHFWAWVVDGFEDQIVKLSTDGKILQTVAFPDQAVAAFAASGSTLAYVVTSQVKPDELWLSDGADVRRISTFNDDFPKLVRPRQIQYSANDGLKIEALLYEPDEANRPKDGWKTVLLIHGGPSGRWSHKINDWAQLLVSRGFAVIAPNIRGSIGYGLSFIRANRHDWGGADYRDAISAIDYLIEEGVSDPDKVAIAGWSYGGYLSAWAITQTDRFKAAVIGAPMTDLAVEYGTEIASINAYDTWYLGTPYEQLDEFARMSPMTFIKNARTPALILIGEEDEIDPPAQSLQFLRGLRRYGVDAELVLYPREGHRIKEREHRIDLLTRMLDWLETRTK